MYKKPCQEHLFIAVPVPAPLFVAVPVPASVFAVPEPAPVFFAVPEPALVIMFLNLLLLLMPGLLHWTVCITAWLALPECMSCYTLHCKSTIKKSLPGAGLVSCSDVEGLGSRHR